MEIEVRHFFTQAHPCPDINSLFTDHLLEVTSLITERRKRVMQIIFSLWQYIITQKLH